jgi:hypothetical protein
LKRGGRSYSKRSPAGVSVQAWRRHRPDEGVPPVSEKKGRERGTGSVKRLPGPRALFSVGLKGFPGVRFNILFLLSPFLFLDFCFEFWKSSSIQI